MSIAALGIVWLLGGGVIWLDRHSLLGGKRDRIAYSVLLAVCCLLSASLLFFSKLPGPTEWVDMLLKPIGSFLKP
ncbi:MAG: hypothetical protein K0Q94_4362 [Paenibacillus sp.]|jgi:hypothetical protein|uniref:Uncharacterized protein n=1 Tax=Paenibacillus hemerocallicola TaxID=1172614 RepID=A0A5C4SWL9_9BACL|nr:hypothetical protein [Paenibacillus hemerocallicola]MDF2661571.1 hypothetical protein [Paenibacillus sp.]TNJ57732.1 hypothetical protein FE784_38320 [Paenibacillus hemerocallicola]